MTENAERSGAKDYPGAGPLPITQSMDQLNDALGDDSSLRSSSAHRVWLRPPVLFGKSSQGQAVVALSSDRHVITCTYPDGQKATFRSPQGVSFTDEQVARVAQYAPSTRLPGQVDRARRHLVLGHEVFVQVNTGPPTWWVPRAAVKRGDNGGGISLMIGWYRALIAVTVQTVAPEEHHKPPQ